MSTFVPVSLTCPSCGHGFTADVALGIHITRLPHAREQILAGTFQVHACGSCAHRVTVESSMVYTDFERGHYVAVEPLGRMDREQAEKRHQAIFAGSFEAGPPIARDMGKGFVRRLVTGLGGLREKLMIWDASLDDYVVEAVKGDVLARRGIAAHTAELTLARILDGGHLLFARFAVPAPRAPSGPSSPAAQDENQVQVRSHEPVDFETAPAAEYQLRLAARDRIAADYPALAQDWLVAVSGVSTVSGASTISGA